MSRDTIYAEVRLNQQLRRLEQESVFSWQLAIGFLFGMLAVLAGAPTLLVVGSFLEMSSPHEKARQAAFSVEKELAKPKPLTPEEEQQLLKLGIDDGTEKSTMTWIGYKEYQEQFAKKSEVEQAAFTESTSGGQPAQNQPNSQPSQQVAQSQPPQAQTPPPAAQTPPSQRPAEPTQLAQETNPPPSATKPTQDPNTVKAVEPPPNPVSLALPETPKVANPSALAPLADERKIETKVMPVEKVGESKIETVPQDPEKIPPPDTKPTDEKPTDEKSPATPAEHAPQAAQPTQAAHAAQQSPATPSQQATTPSAAAPPSQRTSPSAPGSTPGPPADGEKSDRESDATSIVDVPQAKWRNGRPLAGKGLNVRTQRPVFDELTTISTAGTNPIVEIEFGKDGVPKNCEILQSSGSSLIDQPIIDCLYRWRASGSQLTNLPEGKTLKYRIRMLLNR